MAKRAKLSLILLLTLSLLISFSLVSASSLKMKESYQPGETMIIEVEGEILEPISLSQISFKRINVDVITEFDIKKLNDKYYIWALAPQTENNYTLIIKDAKATVLGKPEITSISKNFTVAGNLTDYYIKPGFVSTSQDFKIDVYLNSDSLKTLDVSFPSKESFVLMSGKNILTFPISSLNKTSLINISLGKYQIPAFITINKTSAPMIISQPDFKFSQKAIQEIFSSPNKITYNLQLINTGNKDISDLFIDYDNKIISVYPTSIPPMRKGDVVDLNITLKNNTFSYYLGNITATSGGDSVVLPIEFQYTPFSNTTQNQSQPKTNTTLFKCLELSGTICKSDEICSGTIVISLDGLCCTKSCESLGEGSSYAWLGYTIAALCLIILIFIIRKYLKAKPNPNLVQQAAQPHLHK